MNEPIDLTLCREAAEAVRSVWPDIHPRCTLLLGSGWDGVTDGLEGPHIDYRDIPGLGTPGVAGHAGRLQRTEINGMPVCIFQGRRHRYEGASWTSVILPVWIAHALGSRALLLTNAAGGIREDLPPGSLMALADHINIQGGNPLTGPHRTELGPRFPDQTAVYDPKLTQRLIDAGTDADGIYAYTAGPAFETPAEIRMFRTLGADAVGMSTVPEAMIANALGLPVAALSCISNLAAGISPNPLSHEEVRRTAAEAMPRMRAVIRHFMEGLCHGD